MKLGLKILSLLLVVVLFFFYQYSRHVRYLNSLNELANQITSDYGNFCRNYSACEPKAKADVERMIEWTLLSNGSSRDNSPYTILKEGYGVSFDSIREISTIYAYGLNGDDDSLVNTYYNANNANVFGQLPIYQRGFLAFLLDYLTDLSTDIILVRIENLQIKCPSKRDIEDLNGTSNQLELYLGSKSLLGTAFESKFKHNIQSFALGFESRNQLSGIAENNPLLVKYQDAEIELICTGELSERSKEIFIRELNERIFKKDSLGFDYALVPIYIPKAMRNTLINDK